MADGGYDVADYRDVEPLFGAIDEATALISEAHEHGLRVVLDIVPNHSSDRHPWFQAALAAGPGSPERARYLFRDGRGDEPPNDWRSVFGGLAWTRVTEPGGVPGQWYLHLFAPEQPDLDWTHDDVRADFERTLRFWFDREVSGFRIDVAHALVKEVGLPDLGGDHDRERADHPHWDRDEVHEVFRSWRRVADAYDPPRVFVAEAWVSRSERLASYVRADELHTAFNFDFLRAPWLALPLRRTIEATLAEHEAVGAPATWVLSNHDVARHVSRYGRPQTETPVHSLQDLLDLPLDVDLGRRRARAAALLMLALPGGAYVYQGEELGLEEVEDLPDELLQDPTWQRSRHTDRGRDGCRVPIPWSGQGPPFGFGPDGTSPWLPQPPAWANMTAQAQVGAPGSFLELYRTALRLRRELPALGDGTLQWLPSPDGVLHFRRAPGFSCLVNLSSSSVPVPEGARVMLASAGTGGGVLPDSTAWLGYDD